MKKKTCQKCRKEFAPNSNSQKLCSDECFKQHCKEYRQKYYKKYWVKNKTKLTKQARIWNIKNQTKRKKLMEEWWINNKNKLKIKRKIYCLNHKKEINQYSNNRRKTDLNFKLLGCLRARLGLILRNKNKSKSTLKLLGCSIDFLKKHLESKFQLGMSWSNYGRGWNGNGMKRWHIDHIRPCYSFDLSKVSEQAKCFHYTNLQPLWAKENLSKGIK